MYCQFPQVIGECPDVVGRRAAATERSGRTGRQRAGRVVAIGLQHRVAVEHRGISREVAATVAAVDADHQRQLLAFAVGDGVVRKRELRRIRRAAGLDGIAQLHRAGTTVVVLMPVEVVLGRDFHALEVLLHDEVDDAGHGIRAVDRGRATREDVDAFDHLCRDLVDVGRRRSRRDAAIGHATSVDQHEGAGRAETTKVQRRRARRAVAERHVLRRKSLRQLVDEVFDAADALRHDIRSGDLRYGCRRLEVRGSDARARYDDFTQAFLRKRRCRTGCRQRTHDECATYRRRDLVFTFHCCLPPAGRGSCPVGYTRQRT